MKRLKIGPVTSAIFLIIVALCCPPCPAGGTPIVSTDKDIYSNGEKIGVNFSDSPGNNSDWICIVPAGTPDTEAGDYQYMPKGLNQGALTFDSPPPGKYEARAYYNYRRNGYVVSGRYGFSVADRAASGETGKAPPLNPPAGAGKTTPVEKSTEMVIPKGSSRYNVAVFHFRPINLDASNYGITITNTLLHAPRMQSEFVMMDRRDLETFLVTNDLQQNDQIENVINIGTKMGLNFVIAGSVEKQGARIVTNCKLISIEQKKVVSTKKSISMGEANLVSDIMKMSDAIIEAILRSNS